MNKTQLLQDIQSNVYTNTQKRIKGNTVRDRLKNIVNSMLSYEDDVLSGAYSKNIGLITVSALQALAASSGLIPNAFYRITDSSYGQSLLVQASATNDIWENATAVESGTTGSYDHLTDTFTPFASSGEFTPTLTVTGTGSATATKMLYQKIGKVVSISGTITVSSAGGSDIIEPTLPFPFDNTKDFGICCTLADPLQYNTLTTSGTFDTKLGAINNSGELAFVLRATTVDDYIVIYSGQYMTT